MFFRNPLYPCALALLLSSVLLAAPPLRIITTTPHATELVAALAPDRLVAVDSASDYPVQIQTLPRVGGYPAIGLEAVLVYRPDLVVVWGGNGQEQLRAQLANHGIAVFSSQPQSPGDVATDLRRLGVLLQLQPLAEQRARAIEERYAALQKKYANKEKVRVFLQISENPLMTVSGRSFLGRAIQDCGGSNVFERLPAPVPQVSREAVLANRPQVLITTSPLSSLDHWLRVAGMPAVVSGQRYSLASDALLRPGPRLIEGVEALCALIERARTVKMP